MTPLSKALLNAYLSKEDMRLAIQEKSDGSNLSGALSSYAAAIRDLKTAPIVQADIQGTLSGAVKTYPSTKKIGRYAFAYNPNLTSVKLNKRIEECDATVFEGSLPSLIAPVIFKDMPNLSSLVIEYTTSGMADGTYLSTDGNNVTWQFEVENEMAAITKLSVGSPEGQLEIPAFFSASPVRKIKGSALQGQPFTSVRFPCALTSIDSLSAFSGCSNLSSVEIPDSIKSVGAYAFYGCDNLVSASTSLERISDGMFFGCEKLKIVELKEGIESLGLSSFLSSGIESVVLPKSLSLSVMNEAAASFADCASLASFDAGDIEVLDAPRMFAGCTALAGLSLPKVRRLGRVFGTELQDADEGKKLASLVSLSLPSIETIDAGTFGSSNATHQYTNIKYLGFPNKSFEEIVAMSNYSNWNLKPDTIIVARDRKFYYDLTLNTYKYVVS